MGPDHLLVAQFSSTGAAMNADVNAFRATIRGSVYEPNDDGYDTFRQIWNGIFNDRHPDLIVRCAGAADVIAAVNYARDHHFPVAVKGGGHSFPGFSLPDSGMMIDLSAMRSVRIDPHAKKAQCEPGVLWADLDAEADAFRLAVPGGMISHTGIAGLTLGGGFGWLSRKHGLTIDNLLSCDVVIADGRLIRASESENADLFWGLRGGGGNFGIVTAFEYQLHPLGIVLAGLIAYPLAKARSVLTALATLLEETPDEVLVAAAIMTTPDGQPVIGVIPTYVGDDLARGEELIAPFRRLDTPIMAQIGPMPYPALQKLVDDSAEPHRRYYVRSSFVDTWHPEAIDALAEGYAKAPSPFSAVLIFQLGGKISRTPPDATAFSHRNARYAMTLLACWESASEDAVNTAWIKHLFEQMEPYVAEGVYVNELFDEGVDRVVAAYGYQFGRLQELKRKYDPTNFFRLNQNIAP